MIFILFSFGFFVSVADLPFLKFKNHQNLVSLSPSPPYSPPNYLLLKNHLINPFTITFEMAKLSRVVDLKKLFLSKCILTLFVS
jgi:hypothetical protein